VQRGDYYWYDSHESIAARCLAAAADSSVRVGAMRIDSPGGVVAGCFDNVRLVRAAFAAAGKPLLVWAGGDGAYSAGFAWACAGSKIYLPDTAGVGSIGVLSTMWDRTAANEMNGERVVVVRSGERKAEGHPDVALTDGAIGREQAVIDGMAAIFAGDICGPARGMTGEALLAYQGECFYGATAVSKGLADGVMPWEEFLAMCEAEAKGIMSKAIAARLGIAETATEAQIITAIDDIEAVAAKAKEKAATEAARADKLSADFVDLALDTAHKEGRINASEKEAGAPGGLREMGAKDTGWLRAHLSARTPLSALPKESKESNDAPAAKGGSIAAAGEVELAAKYEALSNPARAALARSHPTDFAAMRAAWRSTKGAGAPAQTN
jgi:ClpP class serine protease